MNKIAILIALLLLVGHVSVQAQSGGAGKGQAGAGPASTTRKVNTGQTEGKAKKAQRRPDSGKPVPPSSVGTESDVSAAAAGRISPGSHGAQRDQRTDFDKGTKPKSLSTSKQ